MQDVTIDRNKYIGGSDIPIIMGISPFKKRFDLLLEKAGLKENEFKGNEYTEYGNVLEPKIREHINKLYNTCFKEDKLIDGDIRCHVDGFNGETILEIKTTSQIHTKISDYKVYLVQLLFYMHKYGIKKGILAVYQRPANFDETFDESLLTIFEINIEDYQELLSEILKAIDQFRFDLEKVKENPFITEEELQPNELIEMSNKVLVFEQQLAMYKELEKQYKTLKENLFEAMQNHCVKKWTTNNGVQITLVASTLDTIEKTEVFDIEKFKEENPEMYQKYIKEQETIKKGKTGYVKVTMPKK